MAERYNVSLATARKWKGRDDVQDRSHRPHTLCTTLTPAQELLAVELRRTLLLPLDDLLAVTREFIHPGVSRSGLDRCLRHHGASKACYAFPAASSGTTLGSMSMTKTRKCKPRSTSGNRS